MTGITERDLHQEVMDLTELVRQSPVHISVGLSVWDAWQIVAILGAAQSLEHLPGDLKAAAKQVEHQLAQTVLWSVPGVRAQLDSVDFDWDRSVIDAIEGDGD